MVWILALIIVVNLQATEQYAKRAHELVQKMTLEQKVGQLLMLPIPISFKNPSLQSTLQTKGVNLALGELPYLKTLFTTYHVGQLLFLYPGKAAEQVTTLQEFLQLNQSAVPVLVAEDLEPGLTRLYDVENKVADVITMPKALTLGAITDDALVQAVGRELGRQAKLLGVQTIFAPVVDVNTNAANPVIGMRSCGECPDLVTRKAKALINGIQGEGVMAVIKHFPGHGDTVNDSHYGLPVIAHDVRRLEAVELAPFAALSKLAQGVMLAHLLVPALDSKLPSSLSPAVVGKLAELKFDGLIFTDGMDMRAIPRDNPGQPELQAVLAGNHSIVIPYDLPAAHGAIVKAVQDKILPEAELDARVTKLVEHKLRLGAPSAAPATTVAALINTPERLKLKQQLYASAMTLLKDDHQLPLNGAQVAVVSIGVPDVGALATTLGAVATFRLPLQPGIAELKELHAQLAPYKTVVVALGGLNKKVEDRFGMNADLLSAWSMLTMYKRVALVLFGLPYPLQFFGQEDVTLVAYEDDPEAQVAAARVLLGQIKPQGKLPVSVSKDMPIGSGIVLTFTGCQYPFLKTF
jgi:beta-N-acetylhexosaminidase